jgi:LEA14-like dessication related protein
VGERALRAGLLLLSLALSVGPILAAFASEGWDLRSTLIGDLGPLQDLTSEEKPEAEAGEPQFLGEVTRDNLPPLLLTLTLSNPYSFSLGVENQSLDVFCQEDNMRVGVGRLEGKILEPESRENLTFLVEFTPEGSRHLLEGHVRGSYLEAALELRGDFRLDLYGLKFRVPQEMSFRVYAEVRE